MAEIAHLTSSDMELATRKDPHPRSSYPTNTAQLELVPSFPSYLPRSGR